MFSNPIIRRIWKVCYDSLQSPVPRVIQCGEGVARMCISNKFPGGADGAGPRTTLQASLIQFIIIRNAHFFCTPPKESLFQFDRML